MNELKKELETSLKMEGYNEIHISVILKFMELAYAHGQRDQIAESAKDIDKAFEVWTTPK